MNENIPYIVFEGEMARQERHIKRLWLVILILIALLAGSNAGWIYYESQFEDSVVTQDIQATDGSDAVVNGTGVLTYDTDKTDN